MPYHFLLGVQYLLVLQPEHPLDLLLAGLVRVAAAVVVVRGPRLLGQVGLGLGQPRLQLSLVAAEVVDLLLGVQELGGKLEQNKG